MRNATGLYQQARFLNFIILMCMSVLPVSSSMHHVRVVPTEARKHLPHLPHLSPAYQGEYQNIWKLGYILVQHLSQRIRRVGLNQLPWVHKKREAPQREWLANWQVGVGTVLEVTGDTTINADLVDTLSMPSPHLCQNRLTKALAPRSQRA